MRTGLLGTMAAELDADRGIHSWLPLLAQVEAAIQAVEAVVKKGSKG